MQSRTFPSVFLFNHIVSCSSHSGNYNMGRVKRLLFRTFFSCIKKVKGRYSDKGSDNFHSNPRIITEDITPAEDIPSSNTAVKMAIDDYLKHSNDSMNNMEEEEQDDEECVSFSEESGSHHQAIKEECDQTPEQILDSEEEFSFWPCNESLPKEFDICIADKVFFQGHILPMGISFESAENTSYSVGFTCVTRRSSSTNSNQPSRTMHKNKPRPKVQELVLVTHQSGKAQIRFSKISRGLRFRNRNQKTAFWRFLRVGLMTMPEVRVQASSFASRARQKVGPKTFVAH